MLDTKTAEVLRALHDYRNAAYHGSHVDKSILRVLCFVHYEIACNLLERIPIGWISWGSNDDGWFYEKYALQPLGSNTRRKIAESLREGVVISDEEVGCTLLEELEHRLQEIGNSLDFLIENCALVHDDESALKAAQYHRCWSELEHGNSTERPPSFEEFSPQYGVKRLRSISRRCVGIRKTARRIDALRIYHRLREALAPIEADVSGLVATVDAEIQLQIDIARGK